MSVNYLIRISGDVLEVGFQGLFPWWPWFMREGSPDHCLTEAKVLPGGPPRVDPNLLVYDKSGKKNTLLSVNWGLSDTGPTGLSLGTDPYSFAGKGWGTSGSVVLTDVVGSSSCLLRLYDHSRGETSGGRDQVVHVVGVWTWWVDYRGLSTV